MHDLSKMRPELQNNYKFASMVTLVAECQITLKTLLWNSGKDDERVEKANVVSDKSHCALHL